jgi:flagellin
MASYINTNVMSLNAQRNLTSSQNSLKTSLERLSSGLRINSAKDDAAGLAIADRMTSQIRGMNQAVRNANDAISLAQTGEGALKQVTANLQRMRELAVQSTNETNTASDRQSLDAEFQELLAENDRLAQTTAFNGRKVLDGTLQNAVFQVGANVGETIGVNLNTSMRTSSIGNYAYDSFAMYDNVGIDDGSGDPLAIDAPTELDINGSAITPLADEGNGRTQGSAYLIAKAINVDTDTHGVTATATAAETTFSSATVGNGLTFTDVGGGGANTFTYTVEINGTQVLSQTEADTQYSVQELANKINNEQSTTGVTASVDSNGGLSLTAADGRNIEITESLSGADAGEGDTVVGYFGNTLAEDGGGADADGMFSVYRGSLEFTSDSGIEITTAGIGADLAAGIADDDVTNINASALDQSNVLDVPNSESAIYRIDQALSDVDVFRGTFGAIQSRFDSTVSSLMTTVENVSAARSRIQDADFAVETAQLTRNQILQQAGTAMLAQANSAPQGVLSLLQ